MAIVTICYMCKWTAVCFLLLAPLAAARTAPHCRPTSSSVRVSAVNGTLASLFDNSPRFSQAARHVIKYFEDVQYLLKKEAMQNQGAIRRREFECAQVEDHLVFHLGWGDMRSCQSIQVGEFSHPHLPQHPVFSMLGTNTLKWYKS